MFRKGFILLFSLVTFSTTCISQVEWQLIYFMPYDNDLGGWSQEILSSINQSISSDEVAVDVIRDLPEELPLNFWQNLAIYDIEQSSDTSAVAPILDKLFQRETKHRAFIVLGHGGQLTEVALDVPADSSWMHISDLLAMVRHRTSKHGRLDLFSYQVCSKGSLEAMYELKGVAEHALSSKFPIGAPNYYYREVFTQLCAGKIADGRQLAKAIISADRDDMYLSYTITELSPFCAYVDSLLAELEVRSAKTFKVSKAEVSDMEYADQSYISLVDFVEIANNTKKGIGNAEAINRYVEHLVLASELIVSPGAGGAVGEAVANFASPSILAGSFQSQEDLGKLLIYQHESWRKLMARVVLR